MKLWIKWVLAILIVGVVGGFGISKIPTKLSSEERAVIFNEVKQHIGKTSELKQLSSEIQQAIVHRTNTPRQEMALLFSLVDVLMNCNMSQKESLRVLRKAIDLTIKREYIEKSSSLEEEADESYKKAMVLLKQEPKNRTELFDICVLLMNSGRTRDKALNEMIEGMFDQLLLAKDTK